MLICSSRTSELTLHACRAQRGSVIATDAVLISAAWFATRREREPRRSLAFFLVAANAGLLLVDHIHFQYNGLLLGALLGGPLACCWASSWVGHGPAAGGPHPLPVQRPAAGQAAMRFHGVLSVA